jgi:diadenosine tetraphosphate (Ap4A) HIT family hydrolase
MERRERGDAPPWDDIHRTDNWTLVHAIGTSLDGWLVLVTRRHVETIAELTDDEVAELGPLVRRVSRALHEVVGCYKTYVVQFADHPDFNHVHVHVVPRVKGIRDDLRGPHIFELLGVDAADEVPESRRDEIAHALRQAL